MVSGPQYPQNPPPGGGGHSGGQFPSEYPNYSAGVSPQPSRPRRNAPIIALVIGGITLGVLAICGGVAAIGYFFTIGGQTGDAQQIAERYGDHALVQEFVGGIAQCRFNRWDSFSASDNTRDVEIYDIQGPKGSAQIVVEFPKGRRDNARVRLKLARMEMHLESGVSFERPTRGA